MHVSLPTLSWPGRLLGLLAAALFTATASAQTDLIVIEFNEDDQPGFDLWPGGIGGSFMSNQFNGITVDISTNTGFAQPTNRGSVNGNPPGYTYQNLYEDLLHAFTPTGTLTLDFSGLMPNTQYTFTLYAWDPGTGSGTHEWSITQGTGVPSTIVVDWATPLTGNDTFALVFDVTTTASGTFQVDNTAGLQSSAINGFRLSGDVAIGTTYCAPAVVNSTGLPAILSATGSAVIADNNVNFVVDQLPLNQFGYFVMGETQGFISVGQGFLCLSLPFVRFSTDILDSGNAGQMVFSPDLANLPSATVFAPGDTWNFQCWYRDLNPGNTSNLSDGLSIVFQ